MADHGEPMRTRMCVTISGGSVAARCSRSRAADRVGALKSWRRAEEAILAHLDGEEMFLLPALSSAVPAEAARLRAEHAEIRRTLGEIGLACELHTVRCEAVEAFCASLREH